MNSTDTTVPDIDPFIERFEAARARGDADVADFLPPTDHPLYLAVLQELVRVDLEFAWDSGVARRLEAYRDRFPRLFADAESVRAVAWEEYRLRRATGEAPTATEYRARFGIDLSDRIAEPDGTTEIADPGGTAPASTDFTLTATGGDRYELLDELARGGMGTVYRATDRALGREVAVKVLRDGPGGVPGAARRFVEEARIAGRLEHPGVPAVHDLGTLADGRPFLAMKLIDGRTLADLLKERPDPAHDRGRFVAAFEQVCQAVGYAHSQGVVHRDLKPANIMVGRFGEVQVMDWGLAKDGRSQESGVRSQEDGPRSDDDTLAGSVLGTPAYMPPEQARGETDHLGERADVFGLGAILCEILTGQPPFVGSGSTEVAGMAARAELQGAFARLDACGADAGLVALCRRCLAADPADRPPDAGEVAAAVTALRVAAEDRARQAEVDRARAEAEAAGERKRRRAQLALGISLLVIGVGGGMAAWEYQRLAAEREREAVARRDDEERERTAAAQASQQAVEQAYRDIAAGRWADARNSLLRAADRLAAHPDLADARTGVDVARADLEMGFALDEARLARAARRPGVSQYDHERTVAAYEAAFEQYGLPALRLPPGDATDRVKDSRIAQTLVVALDDWSSLLPDSIDRRHLQSIARAADADSWRTRLRDLRAARDAAGLAALARGPDALDQPPATILLLAMSVPEAERIPLLRAAHLIHPTDFWINHNLGVALLHQGRTGVVDALGPLTAAVALRPQSPGARVNLASAYIRKGDADTAVAVCRAALLLDSADAHIHLNLGVALRRRGDAEGAAEEYRQAIKLDPSDARAFTNLGGALQATGDRAGTIAAYWEAIRLNPKDALAHLNLGGLSRSAGDLAGAIAFWREAARLAPEDARPRQSLGIALRQVGDLAGAEAACREAVGLEPENSLAHATLGSVLRDRGDLDGAIAAHREAIRLNPKDYIGHFNLGNALRDQGDFAGAAAAYRAAIRIDPAPTRGHLGLGHALSDAGDFAGAVAAYREAVRRSSADPNAYIHLANALTRSGDLEGAVRELRAAPDSTPVRAALARAERRLAMSKALPDFAAGTASPAGPAEALAAAEVSLLPGYRQYGLAYRLYMETLAAEADVPAVPTRYEAASAAVQLLAGRDPAKMVDPEESARLHRQAREWLREAVAADPDPTAVRRRLKDPTFAPVREPAGLAALPPAERTEWERLWAEVARRSERPAGAENRGMPRVDDSEG